MQVTVKYFGITPKMTGKREELITLPEGANLAGLRTLLNKQYLLGSEIPVFYNVNGKGVAGGEAQNFPLSHGDVIMIIPPISGG